MNTWLALASSSVVALMLVAPAGAGAQGRHPSSEGTPTGGSAVSRGDGGSGAASSGSSSSSAGAGQTVSFPRMPSEASGSRRTRGDRPQVGTAQPRTYNPSVPPYDGSSRPLPYWWYSAYLPGAYGVYDLWSWGYRPGFYSPYGYSPYGYSPYGYLPYGSAYGPFGLGYGYGLGSYGGGSSFDDDRDERPTGSIRLRVSPSSARVYVDGALVGIVDDFDGLTNHLELDPGAHHLELRAPGYEPYATEIDVKEGQTLTTRAGLKKAN